MVEQAKGKWEWDAQSQDWYWKEDKPKTPSPYGQLGQILGGAGALAAGNYLGNKAFGEGGLVDEIGSLIGGGGSAPVAEGAAGSVGALAPEAAQAGASSLGGLSLGGIAPYAGVGLGALAIGKGIKDLLQGNKTKGLEGWGGRIGLGVATGGISELARAFGLGSHKSTRDVAKEHSADLMGRFKDDPNYQSYAAGMRAQFDAPPPDPEHPFAGKYGTWDEYKNAGLQAGDLSGVYGNLKTFGQDWSNIDQKQREAVTQALIDANLYQSKKGEVEITDPEKAKEIYKAKMAELIGK